MFQLFVNNLESQINQSLFRLYIYQYRVIERHFSALIKPESETVPFMYTHAIAFVIIQYVG